MRILVILTVFLFAFLPVFSLNGGELHIQVFNGWRAFEIITEGDNPTGSWELPDDFDGAGAWLVDSDHLRIIVNHESTEATISEINIDLQNFKTAISNTISTGRPRINFVRSARQAFRRWSPNLGRSWRDSTNSEDDTDFSLFCSGQTYKPNTFGNRRGFVDYMYITGEEKEDGRLFVLDLIRREIYQLSDVVGNAPNAGNGGMPADAWENAALVDTGERDHVALLLSPDGGTENMQFYIGLKGKNRNCEQASNPDFLERNGLACGSYYYLTADLPEEVDESIRGGFSRSSSDALSSGKLEDVDTYPNEPTKVVLADETSGTFVLDFDLNFGGGAFNPSSSSFRIKMIVNQRDGSDGILNDADNVEWTAATTLNGRDHPGGLIFVNEDDENGEVWQINPDGRRQILVARATAGSGTSGIFDLSDLVGYQPASILVTNNMGDPASMAVLINPDAEIQAPTPRPTPRPTLTPTPEPTRTPSSEPTSQPTMAPSPEPSRLPSSNPSSLPSSAPSAFPSPVPSNVPSNTPTVSLSPSISPSPTTTPSSDSAGAVCGHVAEIGLCVITALLVLTGLML